MRVSKLILVTSCITSFILTFDRLFSNMLLLFLYHGFDPFFLNDSNTIYWFQTHPNYKPFFVILTLVFIAIFIILYLQYRKNLNKINSERGNLLPYQREKIPGYITFYFWFLIVLLSLSLISNIYYYFRGTILFGFRP